MKILGLEFSSSQRSVAVADSSTGNAGSIKAAELIQTSGTETRAFGMIDEALNDAGMNRKEIECIAVGLGPGSYTGIRIAIAIAQGWHIATEARTIGISSADAIAAQAQADGFRGPVHLVIDAQRNELYWAVYELTEQGAESCEPLRIEPAEDLKSKISSSETIIGPEVLRWFEHGKQIVPRASMIARLAAQAGAFVPAENLTPIYLREIAFVKAAPPNLKH